VSKLIMTETMTVNSQLTLPAPHKADAVTAGLAQLWKHHSHYVSVCDRPSCSMLVLILKGKKGGQDMFECSWKYRSSSLEDEWQGMGPV